jgi:hypothetical protein
MDIKKFCEDHGGKMELVNSVWRVNLRGANLTRAHLVGASLVGAYFEGAYLGGANLVGANLGSANLECAHLRGANLTRAYLVGANLECAHLEGANLTRAYLGGASLECAYLGGANLVGAYLGGASLECAHLEGAKGLVKIMGVEPGNYYWKRFDAGLNNNDYQYKVGLNKLRDGETFAADERIAYSYPGFHFGSRSWCATYYNERPLEARIRIPEGAQINEPWATDGKASADMIEILQVFDVETGKDVTEQYRKEE